MPRVSLALLLQIVLMDTIGTVLFVIGLYDGFLGSEAIVPESLAFHGYPYVLLGLGMLLQIPTIVTFVVKRGANLSE